MSALHSAPPDTLQDNHLPLAGSSCIGVMQYWRSGALGVTRNRQEDYWWTSAKSPRPCQIQPLASVTSLPGAPSWISLFATSSGSSPQPSLYACTEA